MSVSKPIAQSEVTLLDLIGTSVYQITCTQDEILKFYNKNYSGSASYSLEAYSEATPREEQPIVFSPNSLTFSVSSQNDDKVIVLKTYPYEIIFSSDGYSKKIPQFLFSNQDGKIVFDILKILGTDYTQQIEGTGQTEEEKRELFERVAAIKTKMLYENFILVFRLLNNQNEILAVKPVPGRFGTSEEMAKFAVTANSIQAAVQNSKLEFNADGLHIQNGGFDITNKKGETVLAANQNTGDLTITGIIYAKGGVFSGTLQGVNGIFTGALQGATGDFSGKITASSGSLGGFIIEGGLLKSTDDPKAPSIVLNGNKGTIKADNIELGTGARIKDYLKIGEKVILRRPNEGDSSFLIVKDSTDQSILRMKDNGYIQVGNDSNYIIIDGKQGSIQTYNYRDGKIGWKLSNTESIFNDVIVRGSIKSMVLEAGEVQAVGGVLLIRPSSKISAIELDNTKQKTVCRVESIKGFNIGDYCQIEYNGVVSYYIIKKIIQPNKIQLDQPLDESYIGTPLIDFGKNGAVGIGINASDNASFIPSQSISVFEFNSTSKNLENHIILGKLPNDDIYGDIRGTYGLYAENVLLKGSLVTRAQTAEGAKYSGISTLQTGENAPNSSRYSECFGGNTGEILIWAGAEGTDKEKIEESKFFVDRKGNLYAGSGYFKGTIITDATITASELRTATIIGNGIDPALIIKDTDKGILFSNNNKNVFKVTTEEILADAAKVGINGQLEIDKEKVKIQSYLSIGNGSSLTIQNDRISYKDAVQKGNSYLSFKDGFIFSSNGIQKEMVINNNQTIVNSELIIKDVVKYGDLMEYRPVYQSEELIGYDLYIV